LRGLLRLKPALIRVGVQVVVQPYAHPASSSEIVMATPSGVIVGAHRIMDLLKSAAEDTQVLAAAPPKPPMPAEKEAPAGGQWARAAESSDDETLGANKGMMDKFTATLKRRSDAHPRVGKADQKPDPAFDRGAAQAPPLKSDALDGLSDNVDSEDREVLSKAGGGSSPPRKGEPEVLAAVHAVKDTSCDSDGDGDQMDSKMFAAYWGGRGGAE
jgi:hypothetical protein